ncbi:hypothetical protein [Enterococcus casseliflavus]|uniref:hypothetical protein n=1 Tax=Enterococcus casseliflavus TaxID=37734 RepID=UPI001BD036F4|nr:hypothetical protein [Enterococcus casseliflavus]
MGETIDFPGPNERLRLAAEKAYQSKEFLQAFRLYNELYQKNASFEINQWLVECLQQLNDFAKALDLAEDYLDDYLKETDGYLQIGHLLILDGQYLKARRWLTLGKKTKIASRYQEQLASELAKVEEVQQILGLEDFHGKRKHLRALDEANQPVSATEWHVFTQAITKPQFVTLMHETLASIKNLYLLPKLVDELVRLEVDEPFELIDYLGNMQQIVPKELKLLQEDAAVKAIQKEIDETIAQEDPILAESVSAEINDHLAISYPFLPAKEEAKAWVASYIEDYRGLFEEKEQPKAVNEIEERKRHLRNILRLSIR